MDDSAPSEVKPSGKHRGRPPGYVYFILGMTTSRVKIGRAAAPMARMKTLQVGASEELRLLGAIPSDNPSWTEADMHARFEASRSHGEWFNGSEDLFGWVLDHTLTGDDLYYEMWPRERPDGWVRPVLRRPRP